MKFISINPNIFQFNSIKRMDNLFNFQIVCNSMKNERAIYLTRLSEDITILRDDLFPLSTRMRLVERVIDNLIIERFDDKFNISNDVKLIYKTKYFDSTQIALSEYCREKNYKLKIFSPVTDRNNNSFSELSMSLNDRTKYIFYDSEEEYNIYVSENRGEYIEVPSELNHHSAIEVLNELLDEVDQKVKYDSVWLSIVDSDLIAKVFSQRGKKINALFLSDYKTEVPIGESFKEEYEMSCSPYYPPYTTNCFVDGKLWKYFNTSDEKILVWNMF